MNTAASQGQLFALGSSRKYRTAPNDKNQQFSPRWIADFARTVFGGPIALDPTSSVVANEAIAAAKIYTIADDALSQSWEAETLFFNPPYGAGLIGPMIAKFLEELPGIGQAIVLVNSSTCAGWYQSLLQQCDRFLLPKRRISFWTAEGCPAGEVDRAEYQTNPPGGNRFDQTLFYFGPNVDAFEEYGGPIGIVSISVSGGHSTNPPKKPKNASEWESTANFGGSLNKPPEKNIQSFLQQALDTLSGEVAGLRSEGIAAFSQYLEEESKKDRTFYRLRWEEKGRVKSKALKPGEVAHHRSRILRRNQVQWDEQTIIEIHRVMDRVRSKT